jgi:nitrile hydratase
MRNYHDMGGESAGPIDPRYIVVPMRPHGTEGMSEADLAALVTRDSMIGVAQARRPA